MLNWIRGLISGFPGNLISGLQQLISSGLSALAGVLDTVFGDVTRAWDDLSRTVESDAHAVTGFAAAVYGQLRQLITHDIPVWAHTAWWWVTTPAALATALFWHLVRLLEDNAWTAAQWLGEFALALIGANARRIAQLAETIVTAVF